jgi:hypothetical protein
MTDQPDRDDRAFLEPLVRKLPASIEPPHDLWPDVAARIRPARRPARTGWQIAAALLLVAASSLVTWYLTRRSSPPAVLVASITTADIERYARASEELAAALAAPPASTTLLAPDTRAILARNLAIIDSAIAACRRAIAADPSNAALQDLLGDAERQRLEFLQQAARLPRS